MTDKQTEVHFEETAVLMTNAGYFARYRHYISTMSCRAAWEQVESELPFGLRRFSSYDAFKKALREKGNDEHSEMVRFSFVRPLR